MPESALFAGDEVLPDFKLPADLLAYINDPDKACSDLIAQANYQESSLQKIIFKQLGKAGLLNPWFGGISKHDTNQQHPVVHDRLREFLYPATKADSTRVTQSPNGWHQHLLVTEISDLVDDVSFSVSSDTLHIGVSISLPSWAAYAQYYGIRSADNSDYNALATLSAAEIQELENLHVPSIKRDIGYTQIHSLSSRVRDLRGLIPMNVENQIARGGNIRFLGTFNMQNFFAFKITKDGLLEDFFLMCKGVQVIHPTSHFDLIPGFRQALATVKLNENTYGGDALDFWVDAAMGKYVNLPEARLIHPSNICLF